MRVRDEQYSSVKHRGARVLSRADTRSAPSLCGVLCCVCVCVLCVCAVCILRACVFLFLQAVAIAFCAWDFSPFGCTLCFVMPCCKLCLQLIARGEPKGERSERVCVCVCFFPFRPLKKRYGKGRDAAAAAAAVYDD